MIQQFVHDIDISHIQYLRHKMVRIQGQGQSSQYPSVDNSKARDLNQTPRVSLQLNTMAAQNASQHLQQVEPRYSESPTEIATELNTIPDTDLAARNINELAFYKSPLQLDDKTIDVARSICRDIQDMVNDKIDLNDVQNSKTKSGYGARHPFKDSSFKKYNQMSVAEYKDISGYPYKSLDLVPRYFQLHDLCGHGTNLTAVISALMHSNGQLVPGIKARKLGAQMTTGVSKGTSIGNQRYVSSVGLGYLTSSITDVKKYAMQAIKKNSRLHSDHVPVLVLGDGMVEGDVHSNIKNERVFKRLNIRGVAVPADRIPLIEAIKEVLNLPDIKVFKMDDFKPAAQSHQFEMVGLDLPKIWANGV